MSILTQGTMVYFIDPAGPTVVKAACVKALTLSGAPATQIPDTCLEDTTATFRSGLRQPAQSTMGISPDSQYESHMTLFNLYNQDPSPTIKWAVGWADGTDAPTLDSSGDFELPTTRTWNTFSASLVDFPFDFATDSVVDGTVPLQRSGGLTWVKKV